MNFRARYLAVSSLVFLLPFTHAHGQDTIPKKEKTKTGWTFGALPVIAYDADLGFMFGALGNVYYYGDGSTYPEYRHSIYAEVSRSTKGNGVNQLFYDSKYLIPGGIRTTVDISYLTERALDFYGFNGYGSVYEQDYTDDGAEEYISRVFYRHERKLLRIITDFQGPILGDKLRWLVGINVFDIRTGTVDIDRINKGRKESKQLPDTTLLYDHYTEWGLIREEEKSGGLSACIKAGIIFDTRDNEPSPNKGVWTEILLIYAPEFLGTNPYSFAKLAVTHRQYFSLMPKTLVLAYRLGYQGFISKDAPFYMLPYMFSSYALTTKPDGLGGAQNLRGVLRNRVVGEGMALGNIEMRWKFLRTSLFKQNFYLGLTGFLDAGMIVQERYVDRNLVPEGYDRYFGEDNHNLHLASGLGLRAALNENFVIAIDYGFALDRRDGGNGLYLGVSNIF
jgi:hypothetical protein